MTWSDKEILPCSAEHLVLEGYRYWTKGFATGSIVPWERAWELFSGELGSRNASSMLTALSHFIRTLNICTSCPLKAYPYGAKSLCLDEYLVVGLISALQANNKNIIQLCLDNLSCQKRCSEVTNAADAFAATLSSLDKTLLPVSAKTIRKILEQEIPQQISHWAVDRTGDVGSSNNNHLRLTRKPHAPKMKNWGEKHY